MGKIKYKFLLIIGLVFFFKQGYGQDTQLKGLGSWNILNFKLNLNEHWSIFSEGQIRSLKFYEHFHYHEYKGGVAYKFNKNFAFATGIGKYDTYQVGGNFLNPKVSNEVRTMVQVLMYHYFDKLKFENRYRWEQRWSAKGYRPRFRYRTNTTILLNNTTLAPKTFYINIWDEIFLSNQAPYFERNRFFAGFGYEFTDQLGVQVGWVNQFDYRIDDEKGHNFLQIALFYDLDWKKIQQRNMHNGVD